MLVTQPARGLDGFLAKSSHLSHRVITIIAFGYWVPHILRSRTYELGDIDRSLFAGPGAIGFLPDAIQERLLQPSSLILVMVLAVSLCSAISLGVATSRIVALVATFTLIVHESIVRGFSGHMNHAELPLLAITGCVAAIGPLGWFSDKPARARVGDFRSEELVSLALLLVVTTSYLTTGAARLASDPGLVVGASLRDYMIRHDLSARGSITVESIMPSDFIDLLWAAPSWVYATLFTAATVLEIAAVLLIRGGYTLYIIPTMLLGLHVSTMVLVGPYFPEIMALLIGLMVCGWLTTRYPAPGPSKSSRSIASTASAE